MLGKAFEKIKQGLSRTRRSLGDRLGSVLGGRRKVDDELLEELEEVLLEADVGVSATMEIVEALRDERFGQEIAGMEDLRGLVIARLDKLARNEDVQHKLQAPDCRWDLIVCDEAHKMSATFFGGEIKYTKRYRLGQLL